MDMKQTATQVVKQLQDAVPHNQSDALRSANPRQRERIIVTPYIITKYNPLIFLPPECVKGYYIHRRRKP